VFVVAGFDNTNPVADLRSFDEDLVLADMEIVTNRIARVEEQLKKPLPRTEHQQLEHEHGTLKIVLEAMESGRPLRESHMTDEQQKVTRAFRLLSEKPRLVIVNTADDESQPERFTSLSTPEQPVLAVPAGLEVELAKMSPADRAEFVAEMGITTTDHDHLIRTLLKASRQTTFFTAGEPEVRTWLLREGGTALEAADGIHTDLARGFIRAEVMTVTDLVRLGSEREIKAHHLLRQEPKDYVVKDDDILLIRFSV
jgi:ribosome-binding ATPase